MTTVAVVSGFERFRGSTVVAQGYFEALRALGYEAHWYQCVSTRDEEAHWNSARFARGVSVGLRSIDQGLNFSFFFPRRLGRLSEEIVLLTDPALLGAVDANPGSLVIVHDLREFSPEGRTGLAGPVLFFYLLSKIRRARGVLIDSESTRSDLARRCPGLPPTAVVHPSVQFRADGRGHIERSLERRRAGSPLRFVYVAVDRPYKQLRFLIDLARAVDAHQMGSAIELVLVSRLRPSTQRYLDQAPPRSLRVIPEVEQIDREYESADALLFPSNFEGFGLPVVEAMSFGLPIISGTAPAVTELLNGAGRSMGRLEVADWLSAMNDLRDPAAYESWASRSLARAEHFSPASFQARLAKVLDAWA
jgi:glycosyltransferase involved in cell wall biosynthesis